MLRWIVSAAALSMLAYGLFGIRQARRAHNPSTPALFPGLPVAGWPAILWASLWTLGGVGALVTVWRR